jgi:hypothetical protein
MKIINPKNIMINKRKYLILLIALCTIACNVAPYEIIEPKTDFEKANYEFYKLIVKNKQYGLLNIETNQIILPIIYDEITVSAPQGNICNGVINLRLNGKMGVADYNTGEIIAKPEYDKLLVRSYHTFAIFSFRNNKWGLLQDGKAEYKYDDLITDDDEHINCFLHDKVGNNTTSQLEAIFKVKENGTWKYIDCKGFEIKEPNNVGD